MKEIKVEVIEGDIVVLGTDGLFDNMLAPKIEEILEREYYGGTEPEELARETTDLAYYKSLDNGGKRDDITVIVSLSLLVNIICLLRYAILAFAVLVVCFKQCVLFFRFC